MCRHVWVCLVCMWFDFPVLLFMILLSFMVIDERGVRGATTGCGTETIQKTSIDTRGKGVCVRSCVWFVKLSSAARNKTAYIFLCSASVYSSKPQHKIYRSSLQFRVAAHFICSLFVIIILVILVKWYEHIRIECVLVLCVGVSTCSVGVCTYTVACRECVCVCVCSCVD